jgi:hypothetical protein
MRSGSTVFCSQSTSKAVLRTSQVTRPWGAGAATGVLPAAGLPPARQAARSPAAAAAVVPASKDLRVRRAIEAMSVAIS